MYKSLNISYKPLYRPLLIWDHIKWESFIVTFALFSLYKCDWLYIEKEQAKRDLMDFETNSMLFAYCENIFVIAIQNIS